MYQQVTIMGKLGQDAEARATQSGKGVVNFSVATSSNRKDRDGNWQEETEWFKVTRWYKDLSNPQIGKLTKGSTVFVTGKMKTRTWEKKDGTKGYSTELNADQVRIIHQKGEALPPSQPQGGVPNLDDIPF